MSATVTLPVYMRLGNRGAEHLVGWTSWDLDTGEPATDLSRMESAFPKMLDESPELQAFGIGREDKT
ncbi:MULTISPECIES: hypothetical protein [unclassified Streptomyces]|uniref:hypothetical protein n=1 Tax=unclassified Streptomyces TaxID=2593676 RepID=UPI00365DD7A3